MNSLSRERSIFACLLLDICLAFIPQKKIIRGDGVIRSLILNGARPLNENRRNGRKNTSGILKSLQKELPYSLMLLTSIMKVKFFSITFCILFVELTMQKG